VALVVTALGPTFETMPPILLIWAVYFITSIMTELVSNNAIAVIMAPIAIALAEATGVDARPLLVAVMIAASACFATPIGYQTNMLVYGPGGYRFTDFMRVGIPLNISLGVVVCLAIPLIFPL
jgi:di/tricarboxylate transporter